jgi:hypothetical protein
LFEDRLYGENEKAAVGGFFFATLFLSVTALDFARMANLKRIKYKKRGLLQWKIRFEFKGVCERLRESFQIGMRIRDAFFGLIYGQPEQYSERGN